MRLCRILHNSAIEAAYYFDDHVIPLKSAAATFSLKTDQTVDQHHDDRLLNYLPPDGPQARYARELFDWIEQLPPEERVQLALAVTDIRLLVPNPRPNKLFLLAGNYAKHIEEGGGIAAERAETFPYVFMKPPTTTLTDPGAAIRIPLVSPDHIDWELELGVVIGRGGKGIKEADALAHVAGYTIFNDISDRKFRPNPNRKDRDKDGFFDWLHGKWHDSSCPSGPCIASAEAVSDPQNLKLELKVNGTLFQDASTAQQIFPVAAVIEFLSRFVTLEPGDMISTGTPAGVGNTTGTYLKPGDLVEATIAGIGTLTNPVEAES